MIPKFSVKKPYTVIVGIILVLVLGVVSLTKLSTDLLPEMNMPYAVVMTTYPGASPDAVESTVTAPVEASMATVSGIDTITSMSAENYSLVILAFTEDTNMDSASLEMREKLDQLESAWGDSVSSPMIMKINPNMAPVVMAAVDMDGMDQKQLTDYVNEELAPHLESMGGVASVSAAGQIEAEIQVVIRQDKIDAMNEKIVALLDDKFAEAQEELDDGAAELEDGQDKLESQSSKVSKQLAEGSNTIIDNKIQVFATKAELEAQLTELKSNLNTLDDGLAQIEQAESAKATLQTSIQSLESVYSQVLEITATKLAAEEELKQLQQSAGPSETPDDGTGEAAPDEGTSVETPEATPDAGSEDQTSETAPASNATPAVDLDTQIAILQGTIVNCQQALDSIEASLAQQGLAIDTSNGLAAGLKAALDGLKGQLAQLEEATAQKESLLANRAQLAAGIEQLEDAISQIEEGQASLSDALTMINQSGILASIQMGSASAQLAAAESAIESAQTTLDDSMEAAYEQMDVDTILSTSTVTSLLTAQNFKMPAGYIVEGEDSLLVRVGDDIKTMEELENLPLLNLTLDGLDTIRLGDVADIIVTDNSEEVYAKVNGNGSLILSIMKQDGYSTGNVSDLVLEEFDGLEEEIPGLHFTVLSDQGIFIDMVVHSVMSSMLYGAVLAVIILFLFLKDLRPTMVIACSIPVSVVLAIIFMYMGGVTLNVMSLGGLSLGIGMLVDNSVVVLENIYRYRSLGYDKRSAAVAGTKEVSGAIVASTLTTICVFVGLFFTTGMVADLLMALAMTFTFALTGSLIIALTFVPMMSSLVMGKCHEIKHPWFDRFASGYGKLLDQCLKKKALVILLAVILLAASTVNILGRGFTFMPEMESTQVSLSLTTPTELTFSETMEIADQVAEEVLTISDVETVGVQGGSSGIMSTMVGSIFGGSVDVDPNAASFYVVFRDDRTITSEEFEAQVLEKCAHLNCELSVESGSMDITALMGSGITIQLYGKDVDELPVVASDLAEALSQVEGVSEVDAGLQEASEQLKITVDKEKAGQYSLTVAQVFQTVYSKIATPTAITTLELQEGSYDLYVKKDTDEEMTREDLANITFTVTSSDQEEEEILLSDIAEITTTVGLDTINRYNQQRYLSMTAYVDENYNVTKVSDSLKAAAEAYELPEGYSVEFSGESETIMEAMEQMVLLLLLAVVCIYLVMVAQFQSLLYPFIIMFTILLAFTGGFLALILANSEISVLSMIGFTMLAGVIVNNGIVLIDYINQLRKHGLDKHTAILEAGRTRLRPVLMTTLTTVVAQTMMAMGTSLDATLLKPMALVQVGGMTYGTIMTLLVVPCLYDLFTSNKSLVEEEINDTLIEEFAAPPQAE